MRIEVGMMKNKIQAQSTSSKIEKVEHYDEKIWHDNLRGSQNSPEFRKEIRKMLEELSAFSEDIQAMSKACEKDEIILGTLSHVMNQE
jgi:hypothetical protein